jgi:hypothetical protein
MSRSYKKSPVVRIAGGDDAKVRRQAARMTRRIAKMAMRKGDFEGALTARSKLEDRWTWPSDGIRWWKNDPDMKDVRK